MSRRLGNVLVRELNKIKYLTVSWYLLVRAPAPVRFQVTRPDNPVRFDHRFEFGFVASAIAATIRAHRGKRIAKPLLVYTCLDQTHQAFTRNLIQFLFYAWYQPAMPFSK